MTVDLGKIASTFSGGTLSCMIAMNLNDPANILELEGLGMGAKTGGVLVVLSLLRMAGGINIKSGKAE
jgi:hypothetical protein